MARSAFSPQWTRACLATLLILVCGVAFWWRLGYLGLIDPDEPFYAQSSREMLRAQDWATPRIFDRPQFEKPIFLYWLCMSSFRVFGENEFAGRAPCALFATLLVVATWAFGARAFNPRAGFLAAIVLATSAEFFISARMILTDMVFAAFVCAAAFSLWLAGREERRGELWFLVACAMTGLSVLTKGPLGLILVCFAVLALYLVGRNPLPRRLLPIALGLAFFAAIAVPWYALMIARFGKGYARAFFIHENVERFFRAEHPSNNHLYYYLAVFLGGSIPWSPALLLLPRQAPGRTRWGVAPRFLVWWGLLCLGFLTLAQSKLPSYALFLFVPLALLIGHAIDGQLRERDLGRGAGWAMGGMSLAQAGAFLIVPGAAHEMAFRWPLGVVAATLLIAFVLQVRRVSVAWIACTASAALGLVVVCLTWTGPTLDSIVSARRVSKEIALGGEPSEAILTSPLLVRGITYYAREPVSVISTRSRPFYTPHPLTVVVGSEELDRYLSGGRGGRGTALCVGLARDWARLGPTLERVSVTARDTVGNKIVARLSKPRAPVSQSRGP